MRRSAPRGDINKSAFGLRLQPQLDQTADGFGAAGARHLEVNLGTEAPEIDLDEAYQGIEGFLCEAIHMAHRSRTVWSSR